MLKLLAILMRIWICWMKNEYHYKNCSSFISCCYFNKFYKICFKHSKRKINENQKSENK